LTSRAAACAVAAAAALCVAACRDKPAPGRACRVLDQLVCASGDRALLCEPTGAARAGGASGTTTWEEVPCKGARGCSRKGDVDECDDTIAAEGDVCPSNPPLDYACTVDRKNALVCKDGLYGLWRSCRGPDGCQVEGGRNVRCDTTLGEVGDPCAQQGTYACSTDARSMLLCDGSVLGPASSCRGPGGCRVQRETRKVECDDALAQEGDPCDQPKRIACAEDRKSELSCQGSKYVKKRDCHHTDCRLEGSELFCD
jgi:hypothetical protein